MNGEYSHFHVLLRYFREEYVFLFFTTFGSIIRHKMMRLLETVTWWSKTKITEFSVKNIWRITYAWFSKFFHIEPCHCKIPYYNTNCKYEVFGDTIWCNRYSNIIFYQNRSIDKTRFIWFSWNIPQLQFPDSSHVFNSHVNPRKFRNNLTWILYFWFFFSIFFKN